MTYYPTYTIVQEIFYNATSIICIYTSLSVVMFCVFAYALATQLEEIRKQVDGASLLVAEVNGLLRACSIRHSKICWAVAKLDEYFSVFFLIFITNVFVQTCTLVYFVLREFGEDNRIWSIFRGAEMIVLLFAICSMADMPKRKVVS